MKNKVFYDGMRQYQSRDGCRLHYRGSMAEKDIEGDLDSTEFASNQIALMHFAGALKVRFVFQLPLLRHPLPLRRIRPAQFLLRHSQICTSPDL